MLILRIMKKSRSTKTTSLIHLILCVLAVSFSIFAWKAFGCFGFPDCYLCQTFSPDLIFNTQAINASINDFTRLIDLNNFSFLMNNFVCNNTDLFVLVLVHSDPNHFDKRWTIRNTWGGAFNGRSKLLFLIGLPHNTSVQEALDEENDTYRDLVQGNFLDTYRNLTYKHVMALKWTRYFCPNVKYLFKTDDDVFVNSPSFLRYVRGVPKTGVIRCLPVYDGRAKRTWRSKWRVTPAEYKFRRYPAFCQGLAILYSPDIVRILYAKAQRASYFWIDDVFITGFLTASTNLTISTFGEFMMQPEDLHAVLNSDDFSYLLGPWNLRMSDVEKLWEKAMKAGYVSGTGSGVFDNSILSDS